MPSQPTLGRSVVTFTVPTYRDSTYAAEINGPVVTAYLLFPGLGTPQSRPRWDAVVSGDGKAIWSIGKTLVNAVPNASTVELWVNDMCLARGKVVRSGDQ